MSNVIDLNMAEMRKGRWEFADGTVVTMEVPADGPPLMVKHVVYCFSELLHRTHRAME